MTDRQQLWQLREHALRHPVLTTLWAIRARGVHLSVDDQGRVRCSPAGSLTEDEKRALRTAPRELVVTLVALQGVEVVEQFRVM